MSETTDPVPQDGGAPPEPAAPAVTITGSTEAPRDTSPGPADTGAATETTDTTETTEEQPRQSRADRRIAALSARLSAGEAERARLAAEVERLRRGEQQPQQQPEIPPEWQPYIDQRVEAGVRQAAAQQAREAFHAAGRAAHADWQERCQSLIEMGGDPAFAELLVTTPDGHRIAAALADEPEEMERIAALRSDRARAIELGKFAAKLEGKPAPPRRAAQVSRAPAPIRPVTGHVNPEVNPYLLGPQEAVTWAEKRHAELRKQR